MMIRVQLTNWNKSIFPANSKRVFFLLGDIVGDPNTLAVVADDIVSDTKMLYCQKHKFVYKPGEVCQPCVTDRDAHAL